VLRAPGQFPDTILTRFISLLSSGQRKLHEAMHFAPQLAIGRGIEQRHGSQLSLFSVSAGASSSVIAAN
jgi:hypothetical protein